MTGHNYPDHFYADALARDEKPLGAYRSTDPELSESERKLRTALAYVNHARDLIREALGDTMTAERIAKVAAGNPATVPGYPIEGVPPERVPKWDPAWGKAPNCDGLSARDIRAPHPMQAEVIRDHDERLQGPEGAL